MRAIAIRRGGIRVEGRVQEQEQAESRGGDLVEIEIWADVTPK